MGLFQRGTKAKPRISKLPLPKAHTHTQVLGLTQLQSRRSHPFPENQPLANSKAAEREGLNKSWGEHLKKEDGPKKKRPRAFVGTCARIRRVPIEIVVRAPAASASAIGAAPYEASLAPSPASSATRALQGARQALLEKTPKKGGVQGASPSVHWVVTLNLALKTNDFECPSFKGSRWKESSGALQESLIHNFEGGAAFCPEELLGIG